MTVVFRLRAEHRSGSRWARWVGIVMLFTLVASSALAAADNRPPRDADDYAAMISSKILCSAVFVSGRNLDEAVANSIVSERALRVLNEGSATVDRKEPGVTVSIDGFQARSRYYGDIGCVNLPPGFDDVFFAPPEIETRLPAADRQAWPDGDGPPSGAPAGTSLADVFRQAANDAFGDPEAKTAALVLLHRGRIVAERYAPGFDKESQLESWSMGKSLTAALIGVLIQDGHFELDDPAPIDLWQRDDDDPRRDIRIADLLQMSSGLACTSARDPEYRWRHVLPDHSHIYAAAIDVFDFAIRRPPEFPPGTVGRYRNCDPLALGHVIRSTVEANGSAYLEWPQRRMFDRIGVRRQVLEPDPFGNLILTGYDYGTARNWARLGLLFLRDGVWNGERILPEGFVKFVSTPAPGWEDQNYGGQFWIVNQGPDAERLVDRWNLPAEAYYMAGAGLQRVFIAPSLDLVVVRLGHRAGAEQAAAPLNTALGRLSEALD